MKSCLPVLAIPGLVPFPGHCFRLHIFEPRYRSLVRTVLESETCEVILSQGITLEQRRALESEKSVSQFQSQSENRQILKPKNLKNRDHVESSFLNSNHQIFEPLRVSGKGKLVCDRILTDGRLLIRIHIDSRVVLNEFVQRVPFVVADFEELADEKIPSNVQMAMLERLYNDILYYLNRPVGHFTQFPASTEKLEKEKLEKDLARLTFAALQGFVLATEEGQHFLEQTSLIARALRLIRWFKDQSEKASKVAPLSICLDSSSNIQETR